MQKMNQKIVMTLTPSHPGAITLPLEGRICQQHRPVHTPPLPSPYAPRPPAGEKIIRRGSKEGVVGSQETELSGVGGEKDTMAEGRGSGSRLEQLVAELLKPMRQTPPLEPLRRALA